MNKLFNFDKKYKLYDFLIGTDEAGSGPLAGPVVAAAVCFDNVDKSLITKLENINDSKQLTEKRREYLYEIIIENSIYSIAEIDVNEIERINIQQASLKAMRISCQNVIDKLDGDCEVFVDGNKKIPKLNIKQTTLVKGDARSASIAAASILAKVYRDNLMKKLAEKYTLYDWKNNKGYGTKKHIDAIKKYGTCDLHRKSFLKKILYADKHEQLLINI